MYSGQRYISAPPAEWCTLTETMESITDPYAGTPVPTASAGSCIPTTGYHRTTTATVSPGHSIAGRQSQWRLQINVATPLR